MSIKYAAGGPCHEDTHTKDGRTRGAKTGRPLQETFAAVLGSKTKPRKELRKVGKPSGSGNIVREY